MSGAKHSHMAGTFKLLLASGICLTAVAAGTAGAQELKLAHQFPAQESDLRHKVMLVMAEEIGKSGTGLTAKVHGGESLLKAKELWSGLQTGTIDVAIFGLSEIAAEAPEFQLLGLPGLLGSLDDGAKIEKSPALQAIRKSVEARGVKVLDAYWSAGAIGSAGDCAADPDTLQGKATRGPSKGVEQLFEAAGGTSVALPANAISTALKTGALDVVSTSLMSFASFKLYDELKCLTVANEKGLVWIRFGINMSKKTWDSLNDAQRNTITDAAAKAVAFGTEAGKKADKEVVALYQAKGVKIQPMTVEQFAKWKALAEKSSYQSFAKALPNGAELISSAKQ
jgi:TRAP-type C4-dicarboxylate transport system substrate-binding protein